MPSEATALPDGTVAAGERLHPVTILFRAWGYVRLFLLPSLVLVLGSESVFDPVVMLFLLAVAAIVLAVALVTYLSFRFRLSGAELEIRSGVLGRHLRTIPLRRVQNVDVVQPALHRLLGVAEVKVETAGGGSGAEATLSVVGLGRANELRERLRAVPAPLPGEAAGEEPATAVAEADAGEPRVSLGTRDLVRAGATANESRIVLAGIVGILGFFREEALVDWVSQRAGEWLPALEPLLAKEPVLTLALWMAGVALALLAVSWTFSVVGAVVRYHGFQLRLSGTHLHKRHGLLTLQQASVPLRRIQSVRVEESVLRRRLGLAALRIETAGGVPGVEGKARGPEAFVPIARRGELPGLVAAVLDGFDLGALRVRPVHPRARRRIFARAVLLTALPAGVGLALAYSPPPGIAAGVGMMVLCWGWARWQYAHLGYAVAPGHVMTRGGAMNRVTWIIPDAKLQTLHLRQSPLQRRHGLATLLLDTASGGGAPAIADLPLNEARRLLAELSERAARARTGRRRRGAVEPIGLSSEGD